MTDTARQIAFALADSGEELAIDVYDVVGDFGEEGIGARSVREALKGSEAKRVVVRINSLGGSAFDGVAIYNLLRDRSKKGCEVVTCVDGIAASAASIIACAGDRIEMPANAMLMIHNAWTFAIGGADEMRKSADMLEKLNGQIALTYLETAKRCGAGTTAKQITDAMNDETWLTAAEAVEMGLATHVLKASKAAASADVSMLPQHLADKWRAKATTESNPAQSGPTTDQESPEMSKKLIEALGAETEEQALEIAARAASSLAAAEGAITVGADLAILTGKPLAEAMGVVHAWRAAHERLPEIEAERDEAVAEVGRRDAEAAASRKAAAINALADAGKVTAAMRPVIESMTIEQIEAFASVAPVVVPGAGSKPVSEPPRDELSLSAEERRVADSMGISHADFAAAKSGTTKTTPIDDDEEEPVAAQTTEEAE